MDRCFRMAIWMFLAVGFLQGKPVSKRSIDVSNITMEDLSFTRLKDEVLCRENVTFLSPASVPANSTVEALRVMRDGLYLAIEQCEDKWVVVNDTLETLHQIPNFTEMMGSTNHTSESEGTRKQFADFVEDCESLFQRLKSAQTQEPNKSQE